MIYNDLFPYVCAKNRHLDAQINKKILTSNLNTSTDLNLAPELQTALPGAKANLTLLMYLTSPTAKLDALDRLITLPSLQAKSPISSDELLPWLIQALIHCQIYNLYSQLDFMSKFNLSQDDKPSQLSPQVLFNLATFEAALEHLRGDSGSSQDLLAETAGLWSTSNADLDKLFHAIYLDDIEQVQTCLEQNIKVAFFTKDFVCYNIIFLAEY